MGVVQMNATTMTVASTGSVIGTGGSHDSARQGPAGSVPSSGTYAVYGAGSHGGAGTISSSYTSDGHWGAIYGSTFLPTEVGAGSSAKGGAALRVTADVLDSGSIEMDGGASSGGAGAGGSVLVQVGVLRGGWAAS